MTNQKNLSAAFAFAGALTASAAGSAAAQSYDYYADQDADHRRTVQQLEQQPERVITDSQGRRVYVYRDTGQSQYESRSRNPDYGYSPRNTENYNRGYADSVDQQYSNAPNAYYPDRDSRQWTQRNLGACSATNGNSASNRLQRGFDDAVGPDGREVLGWFGMGADRRIGQQRDRCMIEQLPDGQRQRIEDRYEGHRDGVAQRDLRNRIRDGLGLD